LSIANRKSVAKANKAWVSKDAAKVEALQSEIDIICRQAASFERKMKDDLGALVKLRNEVDRAEKKLTETTEVTYHPRAFTLADASSIRQTKQ
jgi:predicted  nucleic acid-binding Zn-ribbon protein